MLTFGCRRVETKLPKRDADAGRGSLGILSLERHRHAARAAACAGELVSLDLNRILALGPALELHAAEQEVVLVDDVVAAPAQFVRGPRVSLVEDDDAGRQSERVRAVRPLFPLLTS